MYPHGVTGIQLLHNSVVVDHFKLIKFLIKTMKKSLGITKNKTYLLIKYKEDRLQKSNRFNLVLKLG